MLKPSTAGPASSKRAGEWTTFSRAVLLSRIAVSTRRSTYVRKSFAIWTRRPSRRRSKRATSRVFSEETLAVITLNMRAALTAVEEFVHRAFPYRLDGNRSYARQEFALASNGTWHTGEDTFSPVPQPHLGQGLTEPLLGLPLFQSKPKAAE